MQLRQKTEGRPVPEARIRKDDQLTSERRANITIRKRNKFAKKKGSMGGKETKNREKRNESSFMNRGSTRKARGEWESGAKANSRKWRGERITP